ncbi:MAG: SUMF1/EgtB/PvdO family nonheme iron enzyme [Gammaproteobacteria bacterium]|nr:SUMF1/EgtB/PvdO family nonheme iron enzyme [Gammaproteobacteria bacterium]
MTSVEHLQKLRLRAVALAESLPAPAQTMSHHADLSPLLWHVGHMLYIEQHWLLERVGGLSLPAEQGYLFRADGMPRRLRSRFVPPLDVLKGAIASWSADMPSLLAQHAAHALLQDGYLVHFLVQHHSQHIEIMQQILLAYAVQHAAPYHPETALTPRPVATVGISRPTGFATMGADLPRAYDNERPAHQISLSAFRIGLQPVCNAAYLTFILDGGYQNRRWWTSESWQWQRNLGVTAPLGWRQDPDGHWYAVGPGGPHDLQGEAAVQGVSAYEAAAFARYAGWRLPTEQEWECAAREGQLEGIGGAWEWCASTFHPYGGFRAFPYRGYSMPWFDGMHRTLRGHSPYTDPSLRRPTFRNFYTPEKRHVFAGLRLCIDG